MTLARLINYPLESQNKILKKNFFKSNLRLQKETALISSISSLRLNELFCISRGILWCDEACWGTPYLQRNVLQQRVLQHGLQLPVNLQRQVQGQPAVCRVGGVKRSHDASPPAEVGLVNIRCL